MATERAAGTPTRVPTGPAGGKAAGKLPDRRVRRTRELLRAALVALILERGYERITVSDIITRADVGRSTFYAHFRDKEDLLVYGLEELREVFSPAAADSGSGGRQGSPTLAVFTHMDRSREIWKAMAGRRGAEVFLRHLHGFLSDRLREQLRARAPEGPTQVPLDAVVEMAASTLVGLGVHWWMTQDVACSPQEMDQLYRRLTEPAIRAGLRPATEPAPLTPSGTRR